MRCPQTLASAKTGRVGLKHVRANAGIARTRRKSRTHPWRATAPRKRHTNRERGATLTAVPAVAAHAAV